LSSFIPALNTVQVPITDYALMTEGPDLDEFDDWRTFQAKHFDEPVQISEDLWIGPPGEIAEPIMDACTPPGENTVAPIRQFGCRYAFFRTNAPKDPFFTWDPDRRLATCLQLSRLIRPTTISARYAARVVRPASRNKLNKDYEIIPAWGQVGQGNWVPEEKDNWFRDDDVTELTHLLESFRPSELPHRVTRAMWHYEYLAGIYWVDIRFTLLVTALESLVHTDERSRKDGRRAGSTRQFVGRLLTVGERKGWTVSANMLAAVYEYRSSLAHGQGMKAFDRDEVHRSYVEVDSFLRQMLLDAIRDPAEASVYTDDDSVRSTIPIADYTLSPM
jgi:hypothetical protein